MNSLFDATVSKQVTERIQQLTPQTKALWGKMNVAQMLAHCNKAFAFPLQEKRNKQMFLGKLLGSLMKKQFTSESPWKKNAPTMPAIKITDEKVFETEQKNLVYALASFLQKGGAGVNGQVHPFFGTLTTDEWGTGMYKHLDHHLQQFGV